MNKQQTLQDIDISFFMFTTDMKPDNAEYRKTVVNHIKKLQEFGYKGFEFPIAPPAIPQITTKIWQIIKNYAII